MNREPVSSVEQYILQAPAEIREALERIRDIILETVPVGTQEVISYQMPAYRYNGNLIHFAFFKKHIGLYPGADVIEYFSEELREYETSKGAIRLPLNRPLPEKLIRQIIIHNVERKKDRQAPAWDKYKDNWKEATEIMQQIVERTELKKELKWGSDIYTFAGKNVVGWGGFKDFFSIWFYNGVLLEDKEKVLISASEGKTKALRQWRFNHTDKMDEKKIEGYILEAIQLAKDGREIKPQKLPPAQPSGLLKDLLQADTFLRQAFEQLPAGKQREYIEHIDEARQEKTKLSRLERIKPLILAGKGLNDKYRR